MLEGEVCCSELVRGLRGPSTGNIRRVYTAAQHRLTGSTSREPIGLDCKASGNRGLCVFWPLQFIH